MGLIDIAILQDEIRQALNALFKNRQVGRTETKTVLSAPLVEAEFESESGIKLEEGKKYTVSLDSGDYEAVCKSHSFDGENTFYYLGDIAILWEQFEPTEDSFLVVGNEAFVIAMDTNEGNYIRVQSETICPIDQKYIPALDSLTLNGADGKQYRLSVNESGELVTEATT